MTTTTSRRAEAAVSNARGFAAIGLHRPKTSINVGSVLRAAGCFGAAMVAVSGGRIRGPLQTDTLPLLWVEDLRAVVPHDCVPVAVELVDGAVSPVEYKHPQRAFYVFGPEDGSLGQEVISWCRDVVYVPAGCLNLAACVNVVLYDRLAKRLAEKRA